LDSIFLEQLLVFFLISECIQLKPLSIVIISRPQSNIDWLEARAEITGPPIRYLTPGSTLRLQCRVVQNTEASEYIFWYHDNRMINYDIDRGINVSTEPGECWLPPVIQPLFTGLNPLSTAVRCRLSIIGAYHSADTTRAFGKFHLRCQQHATSQRPGAHLQR